MALTNVKGLHVTPGVYQKETELQTSTTRTGITMVGLVGETLVGPPFVPITINNWRAFTDTFGGTSTELYKGSKYPRYELPYIAKDYLTESENLIVTRVLGLSGYNAGKAWIFKAASSSSGEGKNMLIGVIRSRGHYVKTYGTPKFSDQAVASGKIEKYVQYVVGRVNQSADTPIPSTNYITYNSKNYTFGQKFFGVAGKADYTVAPTSGGLLTVYGYCGTNYEYDKLLWDTDKVYIAPAGQASANFTCGKAGEWDNTPFSDISSNPSDLGTFKLIVKNNTSGDWVEYTVSLNSGRKDYIYNVLGGDPQDGNTEIFIEELYDVAFQNLVYKNGVDPINYITGIELGSVITNTAVEPEIQTVSGVTGVPIQGITTPIYSGLVQQGEAEAFISRWQPVNAILEVPNQSLTISNLNERYLYSYDESIVTDYIEETVTITTTGTYSKVISNSGKTLGSADDGKILVVKMDVDSQGKKTYNYHYIITITDTVTSQEVLSATAGTTGYDERYVFVLDQELYYKKTGATVTQRVVGDISDYKEMYRHAVTPWVVSEMIGTFGRNNVKRLFRFHTIDAGNTSNIEYKVSIQNIQPDAKIFDVVVRKFNDFDASVSTLETFTKCSLNPMDSSYILNRIGDIDNTTVQKSNFIKVEVADDETIRHSFPAGFLGIPVRDLGTSLQKPQLAFNIQYNSEIKERRQYFGFSDLVGIDVDCLSYKGRSAYTDGILTDGFHLDSRISNCNTLVNGENPGVDCTVPDSPVYGVYTWQTPSVDELGLGGESPMITGDEDIVGTIYENISMRKFTLCFYGGFDGWDVYRTSRTTNDDFKANRYRGKMNPATGEGEHFNNITGEGFGIPERGITSDFYAFWAGYLTMGNYSETPINVFATPGIDYVNDTLLSKAAIDVIEEDVNQKAIYIATTPDKPFGTSDAVSSMYTAQEVVGNLDATEIDSSYTATFYPWMRYYDTDEKKTIFLPVTRDVIRSIANIDRTSYSWFPPAGDAHGRVNCLSARTSLKIGDEDTLYGGRVNPVKTFSQDGVYIWGQKNLKISYNDDREALTRIGVRRMMIRIKELVARANRSLLFTPNDSTVKNKFVANTTAILNDVRSNRGITNFDIEVDDSVEARENRTLPAKIWIQPINMLEYIEIEWVITPEGVNIADL
jgi:hypothetical protein